MSSFSRFSRYIYALMGVIMCGVVVLGNWSSLPVVAAEIDKKAPHFSIQPSFAPPHDVKPRPYFVYDSVPGAQIQDSLYVINDGTLRGTVSFYAADATTAETSGTTFATRTEEMRGVGRWIKISQKEITLEPGESREVPFTVTIPEKVRAGQHGGGVVAEDMTLKQYTKSAKENSVKIGIRSLSSLGVLINLPGTTSEKLQGGRVTYDVLDNHQRLLVELENSGTQMLYPKGSIQVSDEKGKVVQDLKMELQTFLPQTKIQYPVYVEKKALPLGKKYMAKLKLNYGTNKVVNHTTTFEVPLANKGSLQNEVQKFVAPPADNENIFSRFTYWHYMIVATILFFVVSALFFWSQKISRLVRRRREE